MMIWTWECKYFFESLFSILLGKYPEGQLLGHMVALFLVFWGTSILFSIVAAPLHIPTNSAWGLQSLHTLDNTCHFLVFLAILTILTGWGDIPWLWFVFLWWLVMLSIFTHTCWSFVFFGEMSVEVLGRDSSFLFCFVFRNLFIYLFIYFGCVGSLLLHTSFL